MYISISNSILRRLCFLTLLLEFKFIRAERSISSQWFKKHIKKSNFYEDILFNSLPKKPFYKWCFEESSISSVKIKSNDSHMVSHLAYHQLPPILLVLTLLYSNGRILGLMMIKDLLFGTSLQISILFK